MLWQTSLATGAFVSVDIESTGSRPGRSSIIEIGAVRIDRGVITGRFSSLVAASESIPHAVCQLTGITDEMVRHAADIRQVMLEFRDFAEGAVLVAHNHRFDMNFLDYEAEQTWGAPFPRPVLDTLSLSRRLHPELPLHNLRDVSVFYGASAEPTHRALPDAEAAAEVLLAMVPELAALGIHTAGEAARFSGVAQHGALSRKLTLATHLPDEPGVYLFRDENDNIIYVGRAKEIRTKIRTAFYAPDEIHKPTAASEVASINYVPLVSGLDALLVESHLHDRYVPTFNRRRGVPTPFYVHLDTGSRYPSVRITRRRLASGASHGPIASEWAARTLTQAITEHYGLRRCRRSVRECERANGTCKVRSLCSGPSAYHEDGARYAQAVAQALEMLEGDGSAFRELLRSEQDLAIAGDRREDFARHRDGVRALDRALAALAVATRSRDERVAAVIEGDETRVTVVVLVHGCVFTTLRFSRERTDGRTLAKRVRIAFERASRFADSGLPMTNRRFRDMLIVDSYRQQQQPLCVIVDDDVAGAAKRVSATVRRLLRIPRQSHAAVSAG